MEKRERILGLDLGVNSIGWALIEKDSFGDGEEQKMGKVEIKGMGVVIPFPGNEDVSKFASGKEIEQNKNRRAKRMLRRLLYRRKRRKLLLRGLAKALNLPSEPLFSASDLGNPKELYHWRVKGLNEEIPLEAFLRILYLYSRRRGISHKVVKKDQWAVQAKVVEIRGEKEVAIQILRKPLSDAIPENLVVEIKGKEELKKDESWFGILKKQTRKEKIAYTFEPYFRDEEKVIDFLQQDKDQKSQDYDKKVLMAQLLMGEFPAHFLHHLLEKDPAFQRLKGLIFHRENYKKEFDQLWDTQSRFYPVLNDPEVLQRYKDFIDQFLRPKEAVKKRLDRVQSLKELVRDWVLFYQRPLKRAVGRGECFYEHGQKTIAKSHPLFQIFRLWQRIQNMKCSSDLDPQLKKAIFLDLLLNPRGAFPDFEIAYTDLEERFGIGVKNKKAPLETPKTFWILFDALSELPELTDKLKEEMSEKMDALCQNPEHFAFFRLWHLLYGSQSVEVLRQGVRTYLKDLIKRYELEGVYDEEKLEEVVKRFEAIYEEGYLEEGYGNLSGRAIRKIMPLMVAGMGSKEISEPHPDLSQEEKTKLKQKLEKGVGLSYSEASRWVYGEHRAKYGKPYRSPEQLVIAPEDVRKVRHPIVKGLLSATLHLIKEIWKKYGKPDRIHVEFARELRASPQQRQQIRNIQRQQEKENTRIREELMKHQVPQSLNHLKRYQLWEEAKQKCLYCGKSLSYTDTFSQQAEIDHIIPRSIFYDNSVANLALVCHHCNAEKGNRTAFDYVWHEKGLEGLREYLERIKQMLQAKQAEEEIEKNWKSIVAEHLCRYESEIVKRLFDGDSEWLDLLAYWRGENKDDQKRKIKRKYKSVAEVIKDGYWRKKLRNLLSSIEDKGGESVLREHVEFLANQLQATRYASTTLRPYLERIAPPTPVNPEKHKKNVLITTGGVTAYLRDQVWKLNETVWQKTVEPYYLFVDKEVISKRDDHRHHALDALIIACTTDQIIHNLNSYHGRGGKGKLSNPPCPFDRKEAQQLLEKIVVFYRYRRRAKSKWRGKVSVRGPLHKETLYGLVWMPPISGKMLYDYLTNVVFKNNFHASWLQNQWQLFQWYFPDHQNDLRLFWQCLWDKSSPKNHLAQELIQHGERLIASYQLKPTPEEEIIKKLASQCLKGILCSGKAVKPVDKLNGLSLSRFAIVERESIEKAIEDLKDQKKVFFMDPALQGELKAFLESHPNEKDLLKKFNEERKKRNKPPVKTVRVEMTITSTDSYGMLSNRPHKTIVQWQSSYVAYKKGKEVVIYTLGNIVRGNAFPLENSELILRPYELVMVNEQTLKEKLDDALEKKGIEMDEEAQKRLLARLAGSPFVVTSIKPSNQALTLNHHSFNEIKFGNLRFNSVRKRLKLSWLGEVIE